MTPALSEASSPPGTRSRPRFGDYELVSLLGEGGLASVYRVRALSGHRRQGLLALKRLKASWMRDPEVRDLFQREARVCERMSHPRVIQTYEAGELQGICYIVMELVRGLDLERILRRCRELSIALPLDFCLFLADALLDGLAHAHGHGVIHCDVSPSNLFISDVGEVKLGDFGVARTVDGPQTARLAGKPHYVSPEFARGEVSPAADLWAATVVLYELLTLHRPFEAPAADFVLREIRKGRWAVPSVHRPDLPAALDALLRKAFSPAPRQRFGSADEFRSALRPHLNRDVGTPLAIASLVRGVFRTLPPPQDPFGP